MINRVRRKQRVRVASFFNPDVYVALHVVSLFQSEAVTRELIFSLLWLSNKQYEMKDASIVLDLQLINS